MSRVQQGNCRVLREGGESMPQRHCRWTSPSGVDDQGRMTMTCPVVGSVGWIANTFIGPETTR